MCRAVYFWEGGFLPEPTTGMGAGGPRFEAAVAETGTTAVCVPVICSCPFWAMNLGKTEAVWLVAADAKLDASSVVYDGDVDTWSRNVSLIVTLRDAWNYHPDSEFLFADKLQHTP